MASTDGQVYFQKERIQRAACPDSQLRDPIALALPVAVKFRIDLEELWSSGYNWDKILPANIQK